MTKLLDWSTMVPARRSLLRRAGFDDRLAERVAGDLRYDVQAVMNLIERGCPPHLAARILAPLDRDRP